MTDSIMQCARECYITGAAAGLHQHHIYPGSRRRASEKWGCWVWLRWDWHVGSDYAVHNDTKLAKKLKRECQEKFEVLHGHEKFMQVFYKNYIEE